MSTTHYSPLIFDKEGKSLRADNMRLIYLFLADAVAFTCAYAEKAGWSTAKSYGVDTSILHQLLGKPADFYEALQRLPTHYNSELSVFSNPPWDVAKLFDAYVAVDSPAPLSDTQMEESSLNNLSATQARIARLKRQLEEAEQQEEELLDDIRVAVSRRLMREKYAAHAEATNSTTAQEYQAILDKQREQQTNKS